METGSAQFWFFDGTIWFDHWPLEDITHSTQRSFGIVQIEAPPIAQAGAG
jgi:hypothetical protein